MITIYSTSDCGFCHRLKTGLQREGIQYAEINIENDPQAASFVENANGGNQVVPTVVCPNGTIMTNPTVAEVKNCLSTTAQAGAHAASRAKHVDATWNSFASRRMPS